MKEESLKAKLAKTMEKKELVKKYDEYEQQKEKETVKPNKEKKIVYKLAESSSSSSDEEEEVVYVKKIKDKKQVHHKKEDEDSLDSTLYKSSQELLHKRAIEERVRANLIKWNRAMMPQEYLSIFNMLSKFFLNIGFPFVASITKALKDSFVA